MKASLLFRNDKVPFATEALCFDDGVHRRHGGQWSKKRPVCRRLPDRSLRNVIEVRDFPLIRDQIRQVVSGEKLTQAGNLCLKIGPDIWISGVLWYAVCMTEQSPIQTASGEPLGSRYFSWAKSGRVRWLAVVAGVALWLILRPSSSPLQVAVESVGGEYDERNLDLSGLTDGTLGSVTSAAFHFIRNRAQRIERRSISIYFLPNNVTDEWLMQNGRLLTTAPVDWLNFSDQNISDDGLSQLAGMKSLIHLHLPRTRISDQSIGTLLKMPDLVSVDLTGTQVTEQGLTALLAHRRLRRLSINGELLSPTFVTRLNQSAQIRELTLRRASAEQVARAAQLRNVSCLTFTETTESSVTALAQLTGVKDMTLLDPALSPDSIQFLQTALPNARIYPTMSLLECETIQNANNHRLTMFLCTLLVSVGSVVYLAVRFWFRWRKQPVTIVAPPAA